MISTIPVIDISPFALLDISAVVTPIAGIVAESLASLGAMVTLFSPEL